MPVPVFTAPAESRAHAAEGPYPLEFLPRKADNYMNSTLANLEGHRKMEARTSQRLELLVRSERALSVLVPKPQHIGWWISGERAAEVVLQTSALVYDLSSVSRAGRTTGYV